MRTQFLALLCCHDAGALVVLPSLRQPLRARAARHGGVALQQDWNVNVTGSLESVVRSVTGDESYRFGDFGRAAAQGSKDAVEGAVRKATGDEAYEFGDLTKAATKNSKQAVEDVVRKATGDEKYEFGDLTKRAMSDADRMVSDSLGDLSQAMLGFRLTGAQERALFTGIIELGCPILLTYAIVASAVRGCTFAFAWAVASRSSGFSPLVAGQWAAFVSTHATVCLALEPLLLPLRAGLVLLLVLPYRSFVKSLECRLPWQTSRPLLCGAAALALTYGLSTGLVAASTWLSVKLIGWATRVPAF